MKGFFFTPGFFKIAWRVARVCFSTCSGQMSTLVTTKKTGTFRASATPMCSLHIPTMPAENIRAAVESGQATLTVADQGDARPLSHWLPLSYDTCMEASGILHASLLYLPHRVQGYSQSRACHHYVQIHPYGRAQQVLVAVSVVNTAPQTTAGQGLPRNNKPALAPTIKQA